MVESSFANKLARVMGFSRIEKPAPPPEPQVATPEPEVDLKVEEKPLRPTITILEVTANEHAQPSERARAFAADVSAVVIEGKDNGQWPDLFSYFSTSAFGKLETISERGGGFINIAWGVNPSKKIDLSELKGAYLHYTDQVEHNRILVKLSKTSSETASVAIAILLSTKLKDSNHRPTPATFYIFTENQQADDFVSACKDDSQFPLQVLAALLPNIKLIPKDIEDQYRIDGDTLEISCPQTKSVILKDARLL